MRTIILAGGLGTRLREETEYRPKPLVDVGGKPILWHIMKTYAHYGYTDFLVCLGYRGNMIKDYFLNYDALNNDFTIKLGHNGQITYHGDHKEQGFSVTLVDTGLDTMTGERVRRAQRLVDDDTFMVTYGDGLANIDIQALIDFHHSHGRIATVTTIRPISRYGLIELASGGEVLSFVEKPHLENWVNAGYFVFNRRIFDYLDDCNCVLEREPLERLAKDEELMAFRHNGFFYAMDTYREYVYLNELWNEGRALWKVWE